jgi:hypothetical protein
VKKVDDFIVWFTQHRTVFGGFFASVGAILVGAGTIYDSDAFAKAGALVVLISTHVSMSGMFKSDKFYTDKAKLVETKIDRRNPDSLIPVKDLKKLLADDPTKGEK